MTNPKTTAPSTPSNEATGELVIVRYFKHWKTGKIIYPRNGEFFAFHPKNRK